MGYAFRFGSVGFSRRKFVNSDLDFTEVFSYGFGIRTNSGIDYGLVYKRILQENPETNGSGWGADVGVLINMLPEWKIGVNIQNISASNLDLYPNWRVGTSYRWEKLLFSFLHC